MFSPLVNLAIVAVLALALAVLGVAAVIQQLTLGAPDRNVIMAIIYVLGLLQAYSKLDQAVVTHKGTNGDGTNGH